MSHSFSEENHKFPEVELEDTPYCCIMRAHVLSAERDGFTERPWRAGGGGACGIRRFNHPWREGDDDIAACAGKSEMRNAVLLTGLQTTPTRARGCSDPPSENRTSARADAIQHLHQGYIGIILHFL
ncbi:unnamed protein product [Pieris brassicae]|uniref:Uncharacterized protein n=1 Tax=Pieris brassicae TaxID=7116 RepID=A0A9P0TVB3_PIEBR|nr:unnamed protein product [Pieris brassicae]